MANLTGFPEYPCRRPDEHDPHVWQGIAVVMDGQVQSPARWCPGVIEVELDVEDGDPPAGLDQ